MNHSPLSNNLFSKAKQIISGGCSTPFFDIHKENRGIVFIKRGKGSKIVDIDNNSYIDFVCGYGSLILGHADQNIISAISKQATEGILYCLPTENEVELSQIIVNSSQGIDQVRFTCSGTEAVMTAVRLAKYYTNRSKLLRFNGLYHGHSDAVLGRITPEANEGQFGIDASIFNNTLIANYNNVAEVIKFFEQYGYEIAAVLVEPIACNGGLQLPKKDFLQTLRSLCTEYGSLLIFDEVITGFRLNFGRANLIEIVPDLITFGKIIGGGSPIGAYAGRHEIMKYHNSELDGMHFSGTFAANPLTVAIALAVLKELYDGKIYHKLETLGQYLENKVANRLAAYSNCFQFNRLHSIFSLRLVKNGLNYPTSYKDHSNLQTNLMRRGVLITPTADETMYLSSAHTLEDIDIFVESLKKEFSLMFD